MFKVDDYDAAIALKKQLEDAIPFNVRLTQEACDLLRGKDAIASPDQWYAVELVGYLGDDGGISIGFQSKVDESAPCLISLTHTRMDSEHELAQAVKDYQNQRVRRLKLRNQKGFAAELLSQVKNSKKKKRKQGFG